MKQRERFEKNRESRKKRKPVVQTSYWSVLVLQACDRLSDWAGHV